MKHLGHSPNRSKIHNLFVQIEDKNYDEMAKKFVHVYKALNWKWYTNNDYIVPDIHMIKNMIKYLVHDLKLMIDNDTNIIRKTDNFYIGTGGIMCKIYNEDNNWILDIKLEINGYSVES